MKYGGSPNNWKSARTNTAPTIVASGGSVSPTAYLSGGSFIKVRTPEGLVTRRMTIEEIKILCSFPSDFVLTGSFEQQWERMGRSVPPLMMRSVAETVRDRILRTL